MSTLEWILLGTFSMSLFSLAGAFALFIKDDLLRKIILPMVSLSAGALMGGAFLHMIPEAVEAMGNEKIVWIWILTGFSLFFVLEQFIHWHHCHETECEHATPFTYLILIADGLHNFIDGLAIAGALIIDFKVGLITWVASAAHEIPRELGDFGALIHGGWEKKKALWFNFITGLIMVFGGIVAYYFSGKYNVDFLLPFAAGNFIYISASDLIPEVKHSQSLQTNAIHFASFILGIAIIFIVGMLNVG